MTTFLQVLVSGLLVGGLYGLLSSGLSLCFGITRIVNFAHGEFVTIGMYATVFLSSAAAGWLVVSLPLVSVVVGLVGAGIFVVLLNRTLAGGSEAEKHIPQIVVTVGLATAGQGAMLMAFGPRQRYPEVLSSTIKIGPVFVPVAQLVAFVTALVAFAVLQLVVTRTDFGRALRAVVDDREAAEMSGINLRRVLATSFGIGCALAALAGGLLATYLGVTPTSGAALLAIAFVTVVLGGLGNVVGALVGGLVVGIIQQGSATYLGTDMQNVILWIAFVVILLFRATGIAGTKVAAA